MLQKFIISIVVAFVLRQVKKYGELINWDLLKADLDVRIAALFPGTFFDEAAIAAGNYVLDGCKVALADVDDLKAIVVAVATEQWPQAVEALKALLLKVWQSMPTKTPAQDQAIADTLHLSLT